jgi:cytidylate kinase
MGAAMAIVTISSELGAGGAEIGAALAKRLGYRYLDREVLAEAANRYGLAEAKLVRVDETKPSLFERVDAEGRLYVVGITAVLLEFAQSDDVVLMGRGGQCLLRDIPHALHVRVTAPFDVRVARLAQHAGGETGRTLPSRAWLHVVRRDDAGRIGRLRYLYRVDIRDPALYDLVINTTQVASVAAVEALATMARRPEFAPTEAGRKIVLDRRLSSLVEVALAQDPDTRRRRISVATTGGVVTLRGTGDLAPAAKTVRDVPGVSEVKIVEVEPLPPGFM